MLARRPDAMPCLVTFLLLLIALPARAEEPSFELGVDSVKRERTKRSDDSGYLPDAAANAPCAGCLEQEPNGGPGDATPLVLGEPMAGDLAAGDQDWYSLECTAEGYVAFSTMPLEQSTTDTILRVYAADGTTLLFADDDGGLGLFSSVQHVPCAAGEILFAEVTHFSSSGTGGYQIVAEGDVAPPPVPANDLVTASVPVDCNGVTSGTTLGSHDDLGLQVECVPYRPMGGDVFYRVTLPYSYQLNVQVTPVTPFDPSVYLFTDAQAPQRSCIAGSDEGFLDDAELVVYINEDDTNPSQEIYLAVDSWSRESSGEFLLSVSCEFVIPTQTASWSSLKSRF